MKSFIIIGLFVAIIALALAEEEKYTTKYDNVNIDQIIQNDRLMRSYVDCCLGKKKCTKDGEELKKHLSEAIQTSCAKCSEAQKRGSRKIIRHLLKNKRSWWNELQAKYDPEGVYVKMHAEELKAEGITL
ncbi:unnamed protein product [Ceutorhynchus assimilis]|uniref:Chemosensory protein n=1 Tax=Ceutorhynchus assimilis TaxID=467358 RepID=A0A9N9MGS1_9CUCU|nr:unnamed protein product [Ceutorhynchus assimilis]